MLIDLLNEYSYQRSDLDFFNSLYNKEPEVDEPYDNDIPKNQKYIYESIRPTTSLISRNTPRLSIIEKNCKDEINKIWDNDEDCFWKNPNNEDKNKKKLRSQLERKKEKMKEVVNIINLVMII